MVKKKTKKTKRMTVENKKSILKTKQKQNTMLNALVRNNYVIKDSLEDAGVHVAEYYRWMKNDPEFSASVHVLREQEVDVFEDALRDLIANRNPQAVIFALKTRGAKRGYVERQQVEHFGAAGIAIKIMEPEDEDIIEENKDDIDTED